MKTEQIGKERNRVDGKAKVTGEAKYAAEFEAENLAYGVVVNSSIAKGKIKSIDASKALALQGVVQVFSHENRPGYMWFDRNYKDDAAPPGSPFRPLYDNEILYSMQPIALVVAETFELARYAAMLVEVEYKEAPHDTDFEANLEKAYTPKEFYLSSKPPKARGDVEKALVNAATRIEAEYSHPAEHHNPIEMHASTAVWEGNGKLTVYDKTQGVQNSQQYIASAFGMKKEDVRVISPFVGGAFGSGLRPQYQLFLAVLAARELRRSVRVVLTRQQMFTFGHRPKTLQRFKVGASADGKLEALQQEVYGETSKFENYSEEVVIWPGVLYPIENTRLTHKLVALDVYTPSDMRAPGGTTGIYALECAIDELAYKAGIDPLEFRKKNYSERDQNEDKPFSSKELRECYRQGAEKFGWSKRKMEPRSMKEGHQLIGWGFAQGAWEARQYEASAKAVLSKDGKLTVSSATADIGTGTYTVMAQIAAEVLGLPLEDVTFKLGESDLPKAPFEGGSRTVATVGSAVKKACQQVQEKLLQLAQQQADSPLADVKLEEVNFSDGTISLKSDSSKSVRLHGLLKQSQNSIESEASIKESDEAQEYARYAHSAVFAEVRVDEELGTIKVTRLVSAIAGGRIINPKTARSQILGGMVWGMGVALYEHTVMDNNLGRFITHDLEKYHVTVNADVQEMEVIFVEEKDEIINPLGVKGLGEVGLVGVAPAIANAIFHATGKRVRELPITMDKLL